MRLENYAVIDNMAVEFGPGLNLLTGETGAGKSILIDALSLLLGDKASAEVIRAGAARAVISAVFEAEGGAESRWRNPGGQWDRPGRRVTNPAARDCGGRQGAGLCKQSASHGLCAAAIGANLATIHAQNESVLSFDESARLALLDAFSGTQPEGAIAAFASWKRITHRIAELEKESKIGCDCWICGFSRSAKLKKASSEPGEEEQLESEKRVLANAEKIYSAAMNAFTCFMKAMVRRRHLCGRRRNSWRNWFGMSPSFRKLWQHWIPPVSASKTWERVQRLCRGIHASPEHLAQVQDCLAAIDKLKRNYGPTLDEVIRFGGDVTRKLSVDGDKNEVLWGI